MTYFFIAGEASGDSHAAALIQKLKILDPQAAVYGMGGDRMKQAGCTLLQDYRNMAFMGVMAVLVNLPKVIRNFRIAKQALLKQQPDVLVLIDYPSFNLRMAKFSKRHLPRTKIVYYIPPKVWAWKTWRIHALCKYTDERLTIFPFETDFYKQYGYTVTYVGNPTVEQINQYIEKKKTERKQQTAPHSPTIALLPGSRLSEIKHCLPRMLQAARRINGAEILIAAAPGIEEKTYASMTRFPNVRLLSGQTYDILSCADVAVVNSGTATLETALLRCPQVAVYHINFGSKFMVRWLKPLLFKISYFTLVNIIAGKAVIRELLAYEFTTDNLTSELHHLLSNQAYRSQMLENYEQISRNLSFSSASSTAAKTIYNLAKKDNVGHTTANL